MTRRSIILGLACAALICGVTFFNDMLMKGPYLIGSYLPIAVFGLLLLLVLGVNPLLRWIKPRLLLTGSELATIVILCFFVCHVAGRGLAHYFTDYLILPHYYNQTTPGWQSKPPSIEAREVTDWPRLALRLREGSQSGSPGLRTVWAALPEETRQAVAAEGAPTTASVFRVVVLAGLNRVITESRLGMEFPAAKGLPLSRHVRDLLACVPAALHPEEIAFINRGVLDALLPGILSPHRLGVVDRVPSRMLVDVERNSSVVMDGFVTGLVEGNKTLSFTRVPWAAWGRAFLFWIPVILTIGLMVTGLALVLHRQWSSHEHLPYPTVEFARALLPEPGQARSDTLRGRLFWIGFVPVLALHLINYAQVWWPDYVIPIQITFDFTPLMDIVTLFKTAGAWSQFRPTVFFTIVGFAFFLPTGISLSLGVAPYVYALVAGALMSYGVTISAGILQSSTESSLYAGAYLAMFVVLLYTGRRYYAAVFRRGFGLPCTDDVERSSVWGSRLFVAGVVALVLQLVAVGVDWQMGLLYVLGMAVIFTVISRLLAEAGVFFMHPYFVPCAVMAGFFGARAVGGDQLLILSVVSGLMLIDPREAMMPFVMSGICLADRMRLRIGRTVAWGLVALVIGLTVAVPVALRLQYEHGAFAAGDGQTTSAVPKGPYNNNNDVCRKLEAQGTLDSSLNVSGWGHFRNLEPQRPYLVGFSITFALVLLFTFCRHRFARWPLHPVLFLMLGTWQSKKMAFSFLLGCLVKSAVTKYGGARLYQSAKPLMIGLVAGEILAIVVTAFVGSVYYLVTGEPPKSYSILGI